MNTQISKATVDDFVHQKSFAIVGASRDPKKFGNMAYRQLKSKGYRVFPVNRGADPIDGDRTYPNVGSLPEKVDGVVIVVPPAQTEEVVHDVDAAGIKRVWMQQGAESENAIQYCHDHGIEEIHGKCILMFAAPVESYHRFHRFLVGLSGKLPK